MANQINTSAKQLASSLVGLALGLAATQAISAPIVGGLPDIIDNSDPVTIVEPAAQRATLSRIQDKLLRARLDRPKQSNRSYRSDKPYRSYRSNKSNKSDTSNRSNRSNRYKEFIEREKLPFNSGVIQVLIASVSYDGLRLETFDGIVYNIHPTATHEFVTGDPASSSLIHSVERVGLVSDSLFEANHVVKTVVYDVD
jgi:hypothetical protein